MPKYYELRTLPIPDKMIHDMQSNVNYAIKVQKEINRAIKPEKNICQHDDESFDLEIIKRLSF